MNNKFLVIFVFMLLISFFIGNSVISENCIFNKKKLGVNYSEIDKNKAIASIKTFDYSKNKYIEQPIRELFRAEAEQIKKELIEIQDSYSSSEDIIRKQIDVLHRWEVLPDEITYDAFEKVLDNYKEMFDFNNPSIVPEPGVVVYGPAITSRLALAGVLLPLHVPLWNFLKPWISITNYTVLDIFNGTQIMRWIGVAPVLVYYCSAMTLLNIIGLTLGLNTVFSPFMSIDILYAGFSLTINIWEDFHAVNMLDWGLGVSFTGVTVYLENT